MGYVIEAGRRLGLRSAGLDVSEYAVKHCVRIGLDARQGDLQKFPFEAGAFDICIMKHVIEHTPDPARALAEVRRILSPSGAVLIAVPDVTYWKGNRQRKTYRYYRPDDLGAQHYVYYSDRSMRELLERNGFKVLVDRKDHRPIGERGLKKWISALRFAVLRVGYALANAAHLRRELFFIAKKDDSLLRS
jgi:SAM-dependent methyltransferase